MEGSIGKWFEKYELTVSQQEALQLLETFFNSDHLCFLLKGYAGTGKTFLIKGLVDYLQASGRVVVLAAPTGRAARILSEKSGHHATTIHRLLYFGESMRDVDESQGKQYDIFKVTYGTGTNGFAANAVFIIDEASMVSNAYSENDLMKFGSGYLLTDLVTFLWPDRGNAGRKLIFVGDTAQLPPVDMNCSPALDESYLMTKFNINSLGSELTEVVRQKGDSMILKNATMLRDAIRQDKFGSLTLQLNEQDVCRVDNYSLVANYLSKAGPDFDKAVIIAHSNSQVTDYNESIRNKIFPGIKEPQPGDRLVVVSNNYLHGKELLNGETGTLVEINNRLVHEHKVKIKRPGEQGRTKPEVEVTLRFREAVIRFPEPDDFDNDQSIGYCDVKCMIIDNLLFSNKRDLSYNENVALLVDFKNRFRQRVPGADNDFRTALRNDPFFNAVRVKYGYAITCHKAQGGEWEHAFVQCSNTMGYFNPEYFRWLYTAITRASGQLLLMNPPQFHVASNLKPVVTVAAEDNELDTENYPDKAEELKTKAEQGTGFRIMADVRRELEQAGFTLSGQMLLDYGIQLIVEHNLDSALVKIYYNARNRITKLEIINASGDIGPEISMVLKFLNLPIEKIRIQQKDDNKLTKTVGPESGFLEEFRERLVKLISETGIELKKVEEKDYHLICYFEKGLKYAAVKFYYNKKQQFTRYEYITARSNGLEDELIPLLDKLSL